MVIYDCIWEINGIMMGKHSGFNGLIGYECNPPKNKMSKVVKSDASTDQLLFCPIGGFLIENTSAFFAENMFKMQWQVWGNTWVIPHFGAKCEASLGSRT